LTASGGEKIGLFWSGSIGLDAARLHEQLLAEVFPDRKVFISTNIGPGQQWLHTIHGEIRETAIGLVFLAPDSLESPWLAYECGQLAALKDLDAIVPVRVGVSQKLVDDRVRVLQQHHATEFGSVASFRLLCLACASQLRDSRATSVIVAAAEAAWSKQPTATAALIARAKAVLPNPYQGIVKHSVIGESNFNMPGIFKVIEREFFLVGINHAYVLNVLEDASNFVEMISWLLAPNTRRRARFLISDMWNSSVFDCYKQLVHGPFPEMERAAFTEIFKTPGAAGDIDALIRSSAGEAGLERLQHERLLEIRTYPTILDTFWFVDKGSGQGRCQLALANAVDGPNRPFFFSGEDDQPGIFNYYYGLANVAFAGGARLWPRP
jgi:hypothetical protein